jgi:hypothetical protein
MRTLEFWKDWIEEVIDDNDLENINTKWEKVWFCSDGISTYTGETKSEAASRFGVPVGFND